MRQRMGVAGVLVAAFLLAATAGCLVARTESVTERGSGITPAQLQTFLPGTTTVEDAIRVLGAPERRVRSDDGREVLTYSHERAVQSQLTVIFMLSWGGRKRTLRRYSFEFKDNLFVRHWEEDVF